MSYIETGKQRAKQSRCFIGGCARNIAARLPEMIPYVEKLGREFADYRVYVFENDSKDSTVEVLKDWQYSNWRICADSFKSGNPRLSDLSVRRIEYMSQYRNAVMAHLEYFWSDYDYMVMVDLDLHGFYVNGVMDSLGHDGWDAIGSNGRKHGSMSRHTNIYYDIFGHKDLDEPEKREGRIVSQFARLQDKYRSLKLGDDLVPVASCFNGLAVYRVQSVLGVRYAAIPGYAEHVAFHDQIIKNDGSVFINPTQLTYYDDAMKQTWTKEIKRWQKVSQ